ncbi:hypothetical protein ACGFNV_17815 [Streptomyces sp. NPDC048751]
MDNIGAITGLVSALGGLLAGIAAIVNAIKSRSDNRPPDDQHPTPPPP